MVLFFVCVFWFVKVVYMIWETLRMWKTKKLGPLCTPKKRLPYLENTSECFFLCLVVVVVLLIDYNYSNFVRKERSSSGFSQIWVSSCSIGVFYMISFALKPRWFLSIEPLDRSPSFFLMQNKSMASPFSMLWPILPIYVIMYFDHVGLLSLLSLIYALISYLLFFFFLND